MTPTSSGCNAHHTLALDIETYSGASLKDVGVYRYADDPTFQILLCGWSLDRAPVEVIDLTRDPLPADLIRMLTDPDVLKTAYSAQFERVCLGRFLGRTLDPRQWSCTQVLAAVAGLPRSLDAVGAALRLPADEQKIKDGKRLIRLFSCPQKDGRRAMPCEAPEDWQLFIEYNRRDVETEMAIRRRLDLYDIDPTEYTAYAVDQMINDRGILADVPFATHAVRMIEKNNAALLEEARQISGLENPNSVTQLKTYLGFDPGAQCDKKALAAAYDHLSAPQRRVVDIRRETGRASVSKYKAVLACACSDHRLHGMFKFYGTSTGRWAGSLVQLQNLVQNHLPDLDDARDYVMYDDSDALTTLYGSVNGVLSELTRTCLIPAPNHRFAVADYSAIEARVIAWLAGEAWRMETFANGGDIYCASASQMFKVPVEKHGVNGHLRQKGKIAELALGYGGSVGAMISMGALENGLTESELPGIVKAWRKASPAIVSLWSEIEQAVFRTMRDGSITEVARGRVRTLRLPHSLAIELPSGRRIHYWDPMIAPGRYETDAFQYMHQATAGWTRTETFGGKLTENVVQAIARDCLRDTLIRLENRGFRVVGHIHDEVIVEVPAATAEEALTQIKQIMGQPPTWARGLVLRGDGYVCLSYRKD